MRLRSGCVGKLAPWMLSAAIVMTRRSTSRRLEAGGRIGDTARYDDAFELAFES